MTPYDFTATPEAMEITIDGVARNYMIDVNIENAADFVNFISAKFQTLSVGAIATVQYDTTLLHPSPMSLLAVTGGDGQDQPVEGQQLAAPGTHQFTYAANFSHRSRGLQGFAMIVYRCENIWCDLTSNISGSPRLITVAEGIPDPSPTTSGMVGQLGGMAGAYTPALYNRTICTNLTLLYSNSFYVHRCTYQSQAAHTQPLWDR